MDTESQPAHERSKSSRIASQPAGTMAGGAVIAVLWLVFYLVIFGGMTDLGRTVASALHDAGRIATLR
jgi:hypothetical protein